MIIINRVAKHLNPILIIFLALVILIIFMTSVCFGESPLFTDSPSYTVVNRWNNDSGKTIYLNRIKTNSEITVHTQISSMEYSNCNLIIVAKNLEITANTNGKILYKSDDSKYSNFGKQFCFIDLSDIDDDSEIYLHLTPKENTTGKILQGAYITTKNDFIFHQIMNNKVAFVFCFITLILLVQYAIYTLHIAFKSKRKAAPHIGICFAVFLLLLIIAQRANLMWLITGSSAINYVVLYSSYMLLPVPLLASFTLISHIRHKLIVSIQSIATLYYIIRILLFLALAAPLANGIIIAHLIMAITIATILILGIKNRWMKNHPSI